MLAASAVLVFIIVQLGAANNDSSSDPSPTAEPPPPMLTASPTSGGTSPETRSTQGSAADPTEHPEECDFRDERERVLGAVVRILSPISQTRAAVGTGFHIGGGSYVTAAHVVQNDAGNTHAQVWVQSSAAGQSQLADVIKVGSFSPDAANQQRDIALLRAAPIEHSIDYRAPTRDDIAQDVRALGYPWSQARDETAEIPPPVVVRGVLSSTAVQDDIDVVQADVQAQSGMSGGPLVDECGVAVAVASAQPQARDDQRGEGLTVFISMAELDKLR